MTKKGARTYYKITQKVDRRFGQCNSKGRSQVWTMQLKRSIAGLDNATQKGSRKQTDNNLNKYSTTSEFSCF
ncbi:MAG: hypothetical protein EAZ60_24555 [Oscillatoriales cyanobacterium]|uniref:hypothetical protein n=1 Tax=unclassified Microcoleus TaxID=2642155 RepID=UPI001D64A2C1|nr:MULTISPECIES: hypothetical protein [unclassified Microcoleus]MCC3531939.1 hypothetical protein [Microcoleus sp. PH2017_21_RUC_O_A]TAE76740.1 MAG: hypothetical protein EAZ83_27725 [Oscillatoriales cyanobacterium]MCC3463667.1 hypothetical protein [Microcoleus sp. PH2017_11_PCY_U_A]MCC3544280.1 hypothetical protein [Microcoleus sp. PH2017_22_RUC_O_B]MCC3563004.1 hypothetical protein [Microcoleus sp. PH2017_27_LUM_O_A]